MCSYANAVRDHLFGHSCVVNLMLIGPCIIVIVEE